MCRNSKLFLKRIGVLFVLLAVLSSPLFSAAFWGGLFGNTKEEAIESQNLLQMESSAEQDTQSLPPSSETTLIVSEQSLEELKNLSNDSATTAEELTKSLTAIQAYVTSLETADRISEAEYYEIKSTLTNALEQNAKLADENAEYKKEAGTKAYAVVGGFVGFEENVPTYGASLTLGIRIGSSLMLEAGADYKLGTFASPAIPTLDLDNLTIRAGIGWMW